MAEPQSASAITEEMWADVYKHTTAMIRAAKIFKFVGTNEHWFNHMDAIMSDYIRGIRTLALYGEMKHCLEYIPRNNKPLQRYISSANTTILESSDPLDFKGGEECLA